MSLSASVTKPRTGARLGATLAAAAAAALALGACGGGDDMAPLPLAGAFVADTDHGPGDRAERVLALQSEPDAQPVDEAARTVPGLYLRRGTAELWDRASGGRVVWVEAGCCDGETAAVLAAYGSQAAKNLDDDAPFFVTGSDLRLAAQIVNRLASQGMRRVFLVTP